MPAPYEFPGKLDRVCKAAKISHGTPRPYHPVALLVGKDILYVKFASGWLAWVLEAGVKSQDFHLRACQWIIEEVHENIHFDYSKCTTCYGSRDSGIKKCCQIESKNNGASTPRCLISLRTYDKVSN